MSSKLWTAYRRGAASRWRQTSEGRYAEIAQESLAPIALLHWVKIQKTS